MGRKIDKQDCDIERSNRKKWDQNLAPGLRSIAYLQRELDMPLGNPAKKEAANRGGLAQYREWT